MLKSLHIVGFVKVLLIILQFTPCYGLNRTDSLDNLLQKRLEPKHKLSILLTIARIKHNEGDHHCIIYAEEALALADSIHEKERIADANHICGLAWKLCGDNSTAILKLYHAAEIYKTLNNLNKHSLVLTDIGETYRANGNHLTSLEYLTKALYIQTELMDSLNMALTYNRLAASNYEIFISRESYQKFIKSTNQTYTEIKKILESENNLKQCLDSTFKFIYHSDRIAHQQNLNEIIISNKTILGALYAATFEFKKADSTLNLALEMIEQDGIEKDRPLIYYNFARLRMNEKRYDEAIVFSHQAYELAQKSETKIYRLLSSYLLGELYQKTNKPYEAIKFINIAQNEIGYFYKNDLGLRINAIQYQNELNKKESKLLLQSTKTKYLTHFLIYIIVAFTMFFLIIAIKNKKLKRLNLQLERKNQTIANQNDELSVLNAEKDKFFSIIAHDLRGPMGTFVSITDLITEELKKNRLDTVKILSDNLQIVSYHLYDLLENLLDWARLQRDALKFIPTKIELSQFIEDSIILIVDGATRKGIGINYNIPKPLEVFTDSHMLQTIIRNLTTNAIKYTHKGGNITISAKNDDNWIEISVEDTGIGMSKEIQDKLFVLNSTCNRLGTNQEPSTGLGLLLCKEFIEKMKGTIAVESQVGIGSKFSIWLPVN